MEDSKKHTVPHIKPRPQCKPKWCWQFGRNYISSTGLATARIYLGLTIFSRNPTHPDIACFISNMYSMILINIPQQRRLNNFPFHPHPYNKKPHTSQLWLAKKTNVPTINPPKKTVNLQTHTPFVAACWGPLARRSSTSTFMASTHRLGTSFLRHRGPGVSLGEPIPGPVTGGFWYGPLRGKTMGKPNGFKKDGLHLRFCFFGVLMIQVVFIWKFECLREILGDL